MTRGERLLEDLRGRPEWAGRAEAAARAAAHEDLVDRHKSHWLTAPRGPSGAPAPYDGPRSFDALPEPERLRWLALAQDAVGT